MPLTRVLDLGPPGGEKHPSIFESKDHCAHYVTLSHCWGNHPTITITKENLERQRREVHLSTTLPTSRGAIHVVRQLRLRYPWVTPGLFVEGILPHIRLFGNAISGLCHREPDHSWNCCWARNAETYSKRNSTYETDMLTATSGPATLVKDVVGDTYYARI